MADDLASRVGDADTVVRTFDEMPVMVIGLDGPDHVVTAASGLYRRFIGVDDPIGRPVRDVLPELRGQHLVELLDRVRETGIAEAGGEWRVLLRRGRDAAPEEVFLDFAVEPRRARDGAVAGLIASAVDVTARVRERQAARAAPAEHEPAHDLVRSLQRHLLPAGLPVLPTVQVAASYLLADAADAAGGDWFDAVPLFDGRVALVVGDVVGHGMAASATMGQLRAVLLDRLDGTGDAGLALAALDRTARRLPDARAATVCVAVLDPADGSLVYCTAGHPPPLLIAPDGSTRYLPMTGAGPLGAGAGFPMRRDRVEVGEVLLLYSDGIVERPGRAPAAATVELTQVAGAAVADWERLGSVLSAAERACAHPVELLVRATGHTDDITLLAAQRVAPAEDVRVELPAEPATLRAVRQALAGWLARVGAGSAAASAVQHAIGELVTNAVEHSGTGPVRVRTGLGGDGVAEIEVADAGRWRDRPPEGARGLGLTMTAELVDELRVERTETGTTATVRHRLTRPARLLTADEVASGVPRRPPPSDRLGLARHDGRVVVTGPVDARTASELDVGLRRHTSGGTRSVTVDLSGVTHLASAGVSVLHVAVARNAANDVPLRIYAPAGSVAQHVLAVVALDHSTSEG
ncbi:SpoIIE family protein phosphatase [Actinokineospora fastidiosa]|uniref:STAS domain-containing protein n=1 Tax=Actinokineospora fastidiosa TaxID=1816 RepID=A0A918G9F5_9PSEU|nr:SpoIIE family protein phosphatase [Actinokineospora fastidiosa]GGS25139.1 hypothetical protein GCM10010171_18010 [Actinokineospora fastidiosa]